MNTKRMLAGASALCLLGSMGVAQAAGEFDGRIYKGLQH